MTQRDRAIGCFIGLAVGDALGAPVEFKEVGEFVPVTDYRAGGAFRLPEGYWTDDTSMALCLADSIIEHSEIREFDILERFSRWYKLGENSSIGRCFDIGNTTRRSLERFLAAGKYTPAEDDFYEAGNGSIMRFAPVAVRWFRDYDQLMDASRRQCITTHGARICMLSCAELAVICSEAIQGKDVMTDLRQFAKDCLGSVPNTGYVLDTMIAAKWAVGSTDNFNDAVLAAANLGGDADTIAAVAGQIAGAVYGVSGIRQDWIERLYDNQRLLDIATQLYEQGEAA
jgi:ADP-ribosyl-[dinitrogen reductase] hydrolase